MLQEEFGHVRAAIKKFKARVRLVEEKIQN
jgi:hypothetical protein